MTTVWPQIFEHPESKLTSKRCRNEKRPAMLRDAISDVEKKAISTLKGAHPSQDSHPVQEPNFFEVNFDSD